MDGVGFRGLRQNALEYDRRAESGEVIEATRDDDYFEIPGLAVIRA